MNIRGASFCVIVFLEVGDDSLGFSGSDVASALFLFFFLIFNSVCFSTFTKTTLDDHHKEDDELDLVQVLKLWPFFCQMIMSHCFPF